MKSPADPTRVKFRTDEQDILQVIVETPAGMVFPWDFGFVPRTTAGDGDPIDVLLLMDESAFPGCAIRARLIGVIEAEQTEGKKTVRNDRLIAVSEATHLYAYIRSIDDLPKKWTKELEDFFVNYNRIEGRQYRLLGLKGADVALRLVRKASKAA